MWAVWYVRARWPSGLNQLRLTIIEAETSSTWSRVRSARDWLSSTVAVISALMRKFSSKAGINFGQSFEEALGRLENGEDPDAIEREMGDLLDGDDFTLENVSKRVRNMRSAPAKDDKLYEL